MEEDWEEDVQRSVNLKKREKEKEKLKGKKGEKVEKGEKPKDVNLNILNIVHNTYYY